MNVIENKPITFVEAKQILSKKEKERELGYEQKITLDYLRKFSILNKSDAESLKKELQQIEGIKDHQVMMLVNLLPKDKEEVKILFMKERINLDEERIQKILGILAKVTSGKKKIKGAGN